MNRFTEEKIKLKTLRKGKRTTKRSRKGKRA